MDEAFTAPPPVLEALCVSANVHAVLVGSNQTQDSIDRHNLLQLLSSSGSGRASSYCIFSCTADRSYKYTGSVSRYTGKVNTSIDEISPARMLAPSIGDDKKESLRQAVEELTIKWEEIKPKIADSQVKLDEVIRVGSAANQRVTDVKNRKKLLQKAILKVKTEKSKLFELEEKTNIDNSVQRKKLQKKLKKELALFSGALKSISDFQDNIMRAQYTKAGIRMTEACMSAKLHREQ